LDGAGGLGGGGRGSEGGAVEGGAVLDWGWRRTGH
jgi:hypothetical protein